MTLHFETRSRGYLLKRDLSPSYFNTGALAANEFILNADGYPNGNNSVWNGNGVRASFLLRLVNANALRVNGYDY